MIENVPNRGVVGVALRVARDVPVEGHAARERARLGAALPDVIGLRLSRVRLDADILRRRAVAQVAAVRVVGTVLK